MFSKDLTLLSMLASSALAAPYKLQAKRQDNTYYCELAGYYKIDSSISIGPTSTETPQSSGNTGGDIGLNLVVSDGTERGLNTGQDEPNVIGMDGLTLPASSTLLEHDVYWKPHYNVGFEGCEVTYGDFTNSSGVVNGAIFSSPLYNENTEWCVVTFPCNPPAEPESGWCGVHITQRERDGDYVKYGMDIYDPQQQLIGNAWNVDIKQGDRYWVDSSLSDDLWVANAIDDRDSIYIGYKDDQWESASDRCSVGAYDENGWRSMDCGFSC